MQYMGGKSNEKWQICRFLNQIRQPGQLYIEPFVGACNTFAMMDEPKIGIDIHPDLIAMWQAVQCGWEPPDSLTEEEYNHLKYSTISPLRGFAGFGCSYSGKWFGGYARRKGNSYNYCKGSKNGLINKIPSIINSTFICCDYKKIDIPRNSLVYCDPPFKWTTEFKDQFDSREFWDVIRKWSQENIVIVSEMSAPDDFFTLAEISRNVKMNSLSKEYLYMYSG